MVLLPTYWMSGDVLLYSRAGGRKCGWTLWVGNRNYAYFQKFSEIFPCFAVSGIAISKLTCVVFPPFGAGGKKNDIFQDCGRDWNLVDFILLMGNLQMKVNHISISLSTSWAVLTLQDRVKFECCARDSTSSRFSSICGPNPRLILTRLVSFVNRCMLEVILQWEELKHE